MSAALQNLLDQTKDLPGLLAAGVFADKQDPISRVQNPLVAEAELGKVWRYLSDAMDVTQHHRMPATQMRWIFEKVLVYSTKRADGRQMGLVFSREAAPQLNPERIEHLFDQFRTLRDS